MDPLLIKTAPPEIYGSPKDQRNIETEKIVRKTQNSAAHVFTDLEPQDPADQHGGPTFGWSHNGGGAA